MQRRLINLLCLITLGLAQHSIAETYEQWSKTEREVDHSKGALEIKSADNNFSIGFTGYLQQNNVFSYSPGKADADSSKSLTMELNAARIGLYGTAFHPTLTYFIQTGFEKNPAPTNASSGYLRDYYLNYEAHRKVQFRIGKFGMPFSRQAMVVGSHMQFYKINTAAGSDEFLLNGNGKDVGIMAHNGRNNPIEWALAVVSNGLVARLGYNHNGIDGYEMTDFAGGPFRFAVAVNGSMQVKDYMMKWDMDNLSGGADFLAKVAHFSTNGVFNYNYRKTGTAAGVHSMGAGLDLGYLMGERHEPVLRYSWLKLNDTGSAHEILAGYNYYIYGQHLKIQAYAGANFGQGTKGLVGAQFQFAL